jgi:hypothetical protein
MGCRSGMTENATKPLLLKNGCAGACGEVGKKLLLSDKLSQMSSDKSR